MQFSFAAISAIATLASKAIASPIEARSDSMYIILVKNSCSQTVWPGVGQTLDSPSQVSYADSGFELAPGASRGIAVPTNWLAGRVFGRTGCTGSGASMTCAVGNCAGGISCLESTGVPGVSLAEFSYSAMVKTFYNLSLISGYNLPMKITPTDSSCSTYDCTSQSCSDTQAYQPGSSSNPTMGCPLTSGYTVEFCPSS